MNVGFNLKMNKYRWIIASVLAIINVVFLVVIDMLVPVMFNQQITSINDIAFILPTGIGIASIILKLQSPIRRRFYFNLMLDLILVVLLYDPTSIRSIHDLSNTFLNIEMYGLAMLYTALIWWYYLEYLRKLKNK